MECIFDQNMWSSRLHLNCFIHSKMKIEQHFIQLFFQDRRKLQAKDAGTPALQVFEEDTRMSADSLITSPTAK